MSSVPHWIAIEAKRAMHDAHGLSLLAEALSRLENAFALLPEFSPEFDAGEVRAALLAAADRLGDNLPYHHPLYLGQMMRPPHAAARLAHALALFLNPNNHAIDGGRATSNMEKEAVAELAAMFGWQEHLGHLCGGGTMANFEALWVSRELAPGRAILASTQAHYTHSRLSSVLGAPFRPVGVDRCGRMDVSLLEAELARGDVGTVVATVGTTACGAVDPLPEILELRSRHGFRLHVDAAYGGYFVLADGLGAATRESMDRIGEADSIVIDPHKHGLQPYGCGCVLFRDPTVGRFYRHHSPYTYFSSADLHLGEISLECSRGGAAAAALWTTQRMLPLCKGGRFARGLTDCREAALELHGELAGDDRFAALLTPELDIVTWAVRAETSSECTLAAQKLFQSAASNDLHLALASFPRSIVEATSAAGIWDCENVTCLRACVMKPEHRDWMPEIISRLRRCQS